MSTIAMFLVLIAGIGNPDFENPLILDMLLAGALFVPFDLAIMAAIMYNTRRRKVRA